MTQPLRPVLPAAVKLIGGLGMAYGVWNLLATPFGFFSHSELVKNPVVRGAMIFNIVFAGYSVVASLALLCGKEWGRRLTIYALYFVVAAIPAWAFAVYCVQRGNPILMAVSALFMAAMLGTPAILMARYLRGEKVKSVFCSQNTQLRDEPTE